MIVESVVDAHHHIWDLTHHEYPWLQDKPPPGIDTTSFASDYHVADYLADAAPMRVGRSVHVQAGWDPADPVGETSWLSQVAERDGYPSAIVAAADLSREDVADVLKAHAAFPRVRGVRMVLTWHDDPRYRRAARPDFLTDPVWRTGLAKLAEFDLSFDLQIYPHQMADAAAVVGAFPHVRFVLDHLGLPIGGAQNDAPVWKDGLRRLGQHDNVAVKLSGFSHFLPRWDREIARPYVEVALAAFGPTRCLFGSNYPVDRPFVDFAVLVDDLARIVADTDVDAIDRVFSQNAVAWYRLGEERT